MTATATTATTTTATATATSPGAQAPGRRIDLDRPESAGASPDPFPRMRAAALVAGPVLLAAGSALHPTDEADPAAALAVVAGAQTQWLVAHAVLIVAAACFVPLATALRHTTERYAPGRARLGSLLTAVGAVAVVGILAAESTAAWALSRSADATAAAAVMEDLELVATLLFLVPVLALYAGLLLLAGGLRRVPGTPAVQPACLAVGALLLLAGNVLPDARVCAVAGVLLAVALVPVGVRGLRRPARTA